MGEKTQISQKNGYLGIRSIKRAENFWNGGLLKKTEFVLSNEFWQHWITTYTILCRDNQRDNISCSVFPGFFY